MDTVNTTVPITSQENDKTILALAEQYPEVRTSLLGATVFQRPIRTLTVGSGPRRVFFCAAHHANEWITAPVLLKYAQTLAKDGVLLGMDTAAIRRQVTVHMVPMVDPDGVDLVNSAIAPGTAQYMLAQSIAQSFPQIPFPEGWKANLLGVDLNLNYPAGWEQAKQIKFSQGYTRPAPRDYVGRGPLDQSETQLLARYTRLLDPALVVALHAQGKEIYWQFMDIPVPGARELGQQMAQVSGYTLADTPYNSSFAGFKDWFIQEYRRPGYTVEVGQGENPVPISQFPEIYAACEPLLTVAALGGNPLTKAEDML